MDDGTASLITMTFIWLAMAGVIVLIIWLMVRLSTRKIDDNPKEDK